MGTVCGRSFGHISSEKAPYEEPLLGHAAPQASSSSCLANGTLVPPGSTGSSVPPSFKSLRRRKTEEWIVSSRLQDGPLGLPIDPDIDPRLLDDASQEFLFAASTKLIWRLLEFEEGGLQEDPSHDVFHEAHFIRKRRCRCRCFGASAQASETVEEDVSEERILELINGLARVFDFCKEIIVLSAIYLERLLSFDEIKLTASNWRPLLVVAILVSSKVWEDVHPWNVDFQQCLSTPLFDICYTMNGIYRLESLFLERMRYQVYVSGELYARYFFAMRHSTPESPLKRRPRRSRSFDARADNEVLWEVSDGEEEDEDVQQDQTGSAGASSPTSEAALSATVTLEASSPKELPPNLPAALSRRGTLPLSMFSGNGSFQSLEQALLDKRNPYLGTLRHAPCASPPSRHLRRNKERVRRPSKDETFQNLRASSGKFGPADYVPEHLTLSGATGNQLARELKQYLNSKKTLEPSPSTSSLESYGMESLESYGMEGIKEICTPPASKESAGHTSSHKDAKGVLETEAEVNVVMSWLR